MKSVFKNCLLVCLCIFSVSSLASLLITPTRVSFDARERTKEIIVVNTSDEIKSYSLSWDEKKQSDKGGYVEMTSQEQKEFNVASQFVRFSPRRMTLGPGQNQKVKMMVRRTSQMPKEEFHSHLKFTVIPSSISAPSENASTDGPSIKMNFFLNYAIPIIVKNHNKSSVLEMFDAKFNPNQTGKSYGSIELSVRNVNRTSSHGNFTVYFKPIGSNEFKAVGFDNAVNIFHEVDVMQRSIPIVYELGGSQGQFKVEFEGKAEYKNKLKASTSLTI